MKITVKIKMGAVKTKIESFGNNRYLIYLVSNKGEEGAMDEFLAAFSRYLGVPPSKIEYVGKNSDGDKIFEI